MSEYVPHASQPRLLWVSPVTPTKLDSATWLDTTRELRKLGMEVTLITSGPAGKHSYRGIEVLNIPRPEVYLFGQMLFHFNVLRFLIPRLMAYDVVLFHQISSIWLMPLRLFGRRRPKLVMDSRDMVDFQRGNLKVRLRTAWFRLSYWLSNRFLDGQTAITTRMADLVGIPPEKLWGIWPSGVNQETFAEAARDRRWPGRPIHLVYVGIFLDGRNLLPLAKAVRRANDKGMSFALSLFGDGPLRPALEAVAAESSGAVRVQRPIPHEEVPRTLASAQIGVTSLPEPDDEKYEASSPIKLFEYMAAGMPVLATNNKCHTDVVGNGHYAFWATGTSEDHLMDALREIWARRSELQTLGAEASADAPAWTWAAAARKLHAALLHGLNHSPAPKYVPTAGKQTQQI